MPRLQTLREHLAADELEIIAVNRHDPAAAVRTFVKESGFTFRVAPDGAKSGVMERYDVRCCPATFVLDHDARVAAVIVGQDEARLREVLRGVGVGG